MKPVASLSIDADNQWSYLYIRGERDWADAPSYLPRTIDRTLELAERCAVPLTCFVVGRDATDPDDAAAFRRFAEAGHEIGNHSFRHEPWLHRYSEAELDEELERAERAIETATGVHPTGFRGPGYSLSEPALLVLAQRRYAYDASTLPMIIGPIARAVYFRTARLDADQRAERAQLYGTWRDGLRPLRPYRFTVEGHAPMLELPVTVMPGLRVPVHISYLLMLSTYSERAAHAYFAAALRLCRAARVEPSILMHPLDVLGGDEVPRLSFFPGMKISAADKLRRVASYLDLLRRDHEVVTVGEHAQRHLGESLPVRAPRFAA